MSKSRWQRLTAGLLGPASVRLRPPANVFPNPHPSPDPARDSAFAAARNAMARDQLAREGRDITHPLVLRAMAAVPRHEFVPPDRQSDAYADHPIPIGFEQTISQPFIVAFMTQALDPLPTDRILEVGTGSGYQAAVLACIVREIHTLEIIPQLAQRARATFQRLRIANVTVHSADGSCGWPEAAPYDAIIVTCAPRRIPQSLIDQLRDGGRMIIPVGTIDVSQNLVLLRKVGTRIESESILPVRFVPMTG